MRRGKSGSKLASAIAGGICLAGTSVALASPGVALPAPSTVSFSTSATFGPDGLLYVYDGLNVFKESSAGGNAFAKISTSDASVAGSDAGPIAFTRDGSTIVVGTGAGGTDFSGSSGGIFLTLPSSGGTFTPLANKLAGQFAFTALPSASSVTNSANKLAVDYGSFTSSAVGYFDLASSTNTPVITGIPGASTSVAFDGSGHLYVGVGFGAAAGQIRRFDVSSLDAASNSSPQTPLDFSTGTLINSAANNTGNGYFVADGYLFAGDGNDGFIIVSPTGTVKSYDVGAESAYITYNATNDQFAVISTDFSTGVGMSTANFYSATSFLPEPASLGAIILGGLVLRRRRAA